MANWTTCTRCRFGSCSCACEICWSGIAADCVGKTEYIVVHIILDCDSSS